MRNYVVFMMIAMMFGGVTNAYAQRDKSAPEKARLSDISRTQDIFESFSLESGYEMVVTPLVASIKVLPNADGKVVHSRFGGKSRSDGEMGNVYRVRKQMVDAQGSLNFEFLRAQVIFDFCRESGADLIVMPQFSARYRTSKVKRMDSDGNTVDFEQPVVENGCYLIEVEMVGFPAVYTNFREATANDRWIKHMYNESPITSSESEMYIREDYDTIIKK